MLMHKKEPLQCWRTGTASGESENMTKEIVSHANPLVNRDVETWSDALDYWCDREDDDER